MAITISQGSQVRHAGVFQSQNALTASTATAHQSLSLTVDVNTLGVSTATGDNSNNLYRLGSGVEGQIMTIACTGTQESALSLASTATGNLVFTTSESYAVLQWTADQWIELANTATIATGTTT